jgi:gamma-glutamylcyclotransferase (GGCT)/AIG2-like uncharacterized protein YtfP
VKTQALYTYGTLQVGAIIAHIVGRQLAGVPARLTGYARFRVRDRVYPAIVEAAGGEVSGVLYAGLEDAELARLDFYEGDLYERREVSVGAGPMQRRAVTYVLRPEHRHELSEEAWDLQAFLRDHLADYLAIVAETSQAPPGASRRS